MNAPTPYDSLHAKDRPIAEAFVRAIRRYASQCERLGYSTITVSEFPPCYDDPESDEETSPLMQNLRLAEVVERALSAENFSDSQVFGPLRTVSGPFGLELELKNRNPERTAATAQQAADATFKEMMAYLQDTSPRSPQRVYRANIVLPIPEDGNLLADPVLQQAYERCKFRPNAKLEAGDGAIMSLAVNKLGKQLSVEFKGNRLRHWRIQWPLLEVREYDKEPSYWTRRKLDKLGWNNLNLPTWRWRCLCAELD